MIESIGILETLERKYMLKAIQVLQSTCITQQTHRMMVQIQVNLQFENQNKDQVLLQ